MPPPSTSWTPDPGSLSPLSSLCLTGPVWFQINAMANRAAGKGYEASGYYPNTDYQFYNIQNIHIMRDSLQRLIEGKLRRKRERGREMVLLVQVSTPPTSQWPDSCPVWNPLAGSATSSSSWRPPSSPLTWAPPPVLSLSLTLSSFP